MARAAALEPGERIGAGGQAEIRAVRGDRRHVLKIYKTPLAPAEQARLDGLIAAGNAQLRSCCAWPLRRIQLGEQTALLLPRVRKGHELHVLTDRKSQVRAFPGVNWQFMVRVAQNLAAACAQVHAAGLTLVDCSERNAMVDRRGRVTLIDCDVCVRQNRGADSCSLLCTADWTAPELLAADRASTPRTPDHDNYALARAVFKLLFQGSDPMRPLDGSSESSKPLVFAFSAKWRTPQHGDHELSLAKVPALVARYFELAFDPQRRAGQPRPTAQQWSVALTKMARDLRECRRSPLHVYLPEQGRCPWCEIATRNPQLDFFRGRVPTRWPINAAALLVASALLIGGFLTISTGFEQHLQRRVTQFVAAHFESMSQRRIDAATLAGHYLPDVRMRYGTNTHEPREWHARTLREWRIRSYRPLLADAEVKCRKWQQRCSAAVLVSSSVQKVQPAIPGCWQYELTLDLSAAATLIAAERRSTSDDQRCRTIRDAQAAAAMPPPG